MGTLPKESKTLRLHAFGPTSSEQWTSINTLPGDTADFEFVAERDAGPWDIFAVVLPEEERFHLNLLRPKILAPVTEWITVGAKNLAQSSGKLYYEVKLGSGMQYPQIGWVTDNFVAGDNTG